MRGSLSISFEGSPLKVTSIKSIKSCKALIDRGSVKFNYIRRVLPSNFVILNVLIIVWFSIFVFPRRSDIFNEFSIEDKGICLISAYEALTWSGSVIVINPVMVKSEITGRYLLVELDIILIFNAGNYFLFNSFALGTIGTVIEMTFRFIINTRFNL